MALHMYNLVRFMFRLLASRFGNRFFLMLEWVKKTEYQCIGCEDGFITVLDADGGTREDLKLPNQMNPVPPGASPFL